MTARISKTAGAFLSLMASISTVAGESDSQSAGELLDDVLGNPGAWNQMCSMMPVPSPTRIPLFGYHRNPMNFISPENFDRLREVRSGVLAEISQRLEAAADSEKEAAARDTTALFDILDHAAQASPLSRDAMYASSGTDSALDHYLAILLGLNGIEALHALLELEAGLDTVAPYVLDPLGWNAPTGLARDPSPRTDSYPPLLMHTRVLSVITALLMGEEFRGLKKSFLYDAYRADYEALRTGDQTTYYLDASSLDEEPPYRPAGLQRLLRARENDWNHFEGRLSVPYDRVHRDEIVAVARQFLEEIPPAKYRGSAAMTEKPSAR